MVPNIGRTTPFFFGPQTLPERLLGIGSTQDPLMLGLCTKESLDLLRNVGTGAYLCVDATYCLNNRGFPVVIYGVADTEYKFRFAAIFIVSHETAAMYRETMVALSSIANIAVGISLQPSHVLSDGCKSIASAIAGFWPSATHLMCYAHMMRAARRHIKKNHDASTASLVVEGIRLLHRTYSEAEFATAKAALVPTWPARVQAYMTSQWLEGRHSRWQRYWALPGLPYSNQGQETFNRLLKDHFTLRRRCKISECLDALFRAAQYFSERRQEELARTQEPIFFLSVNDRSRSATSGRPSDVPTQR